MSLADVHITLAAGALIAHVTGEVDMSNAEDIGATVIDATPNEAQAVILDMSGVDYLDSVGIYVIFGMRASLNARGQMLILVVPPASPVHASLRLAGAERPGEAAETVADALRMLNGGPAPGS